MFFNRIAYFFVVKHQQIQQRLGHPKKGGGKKKKIVSLCYEYRYTTLLGKLDATNRYAYSL